MEHVQFKISIRSRGDLVAQPTPYGSYNFFAKNFFSYIKANTFFFAVGGTFLSIKTLQLICR